MGRTARITYASLAQTCTHPPLTPPLSHTHAHTHAHAPELVALEREVGQLVSQLAAAEAKKAALDMQVCVCVWGGEGRLHVVWWRAARRGVCAADVCRCVCS
jgi:hypothetical protein